MVSICFMNFQFFEVEIAHPRIYIVMILEAGMFLPSYLVLDLQGATEQTLSAFSHYKKTCGFVESADFIAIFWK